MSRDRNYPPTTIYRIHDYETDTRDLEKAKAEEHAKDRSAEALRNETAHLTPQEAEMLKGLRKKKGR